MARGEIPSLRSLPRVFVPGAMPNGTIELPKEEIDKLRKVLRLPAGAEIAVLPDDGTILRCVFDGRDAEPIEVFRPDVEPSLRLTLAQALPKGDKLDEIVRACTGIGVSEFLIFPSIRSIVRWDDEKVQHRLTRLRTIARESSEVSFRTRIPEVKWASSLADVFALRPETMAMSEVEGLASWLPQSGEGSATIAVGPEGGWAPQELDLIGDRGFTLGPRVLRVDHAGPAAAALLLLRPA